MSLSTVEHGRANRETLFESIEPLLVAHRERQGFILLAGLNAVVEASGLTAAPELANLDVKEKRNYALLNHVVKEVQSASAAKDLTRIQDAFVTFSGAECAASSVETGVGPVWFTDGKVNHTEYIPAIDASYVWLSRAGLEASPPVTADFIQRACAALTSFGFDGYLRRGLAAVSLRGHFDEAGTLFSYSMAKFPYTIYLDWSDDLFIFGECLLHESAHCWLNDSFKASNEPVSTEPFGPSPWKNGAIRPAFGLIHAAHAFSILTNYFNQVAKAPDVSDETREYCRVRAGVERVRLTSAEDVVGRALDQMKNQNLADVIRFEVAEAMTKSD